jgi:phage shock protein A
MAIQRAKDKTDELQARASAIDELTSSGALDDLTQPGTTQLDRELAQISSTAQVDDELAKLKAEVGPGTGGDAKQLDAGDGASAPAAAPAADPPEEQPAEKPAS